MQGFFASSLVHKERPTGLVPKCGACGLYKKCNTPKMKPYGKGRRGVLVVGEAPGETEDDEGRPFIGKAGQFLRDTLDSFDVNLDRDALTTNALICRPPGNKMPQKGKEIDFCRPNVIKTIKDFEPSVIITLGGSALKSVLTQFWTRDIGTMERWAGWRIPLAQHWICPTWHPSWLLRVKNELMDRQFRDHLERAFNIEEEPPALPDYAARINCLLDEDEIWERLADMDRQGGWIAPDYETNCIKPEWEDAKAPVFGVSNHEFNYAFPLTGKAKKAVGLLLKSPRTRKIASNIKMEERWTKKLFGHGVTNWGWDTMLATHCLDNRQGICSLKFQAFVQLGVPLTIYNEHVETFLDQHTEGPYNRIDEIDLHDLMIYCGMDCLFEYKLAMKQRKQMGL